MDLLQSALDGLPPLFAKARPRTAFILGSGWGPAAQAFEARGTLRYAEIPHLGTPGVAGHAGTLVLADSARGPLLLFQGRRHWYEGAGWEPVAIPVFLALRLGVDTLVLCNAAGGIRSDLAPGDLMVINDHINAMGTHPLVGAHDPAWGPRFPDQTAVYEPELRTALDDAAQACGLPLAHGIYAAMSGPTYETPAEIEMLRRLGADAVGMSTVPEALLASAAGLRVAGLSCIANAAARVGAAPLAHADVQEAVQAAHAALARLLPAFLGRIASHG